MNLTPTNCPACNFNPWKLPFGKHRGSRIDECPKDYLRWLCDNGYAYVVLQELWCHGKHRPEEHPDFILHKLGKKK